MTKEEIAAKIAKMREKRLLLPDIWQNANGTWSVKSSPEIEYQDKIGAIMDLRFHNETKMTVRHD